MVQATQKTAVVTGASSGVGKEAARGLIKQGYFVIALGRNPERCQQAEQDLHQSAANGGRVKFLQADFSLLAETARVAKEILTLTDRIDVLINNAGGVSDAMRKTDEGFEQTFASNYLSPFLITHCLLPALMATAKSSPDGKARVLSTSSIGHHSCPGINFEDLQWIENYTTGGAYTNAKLGNILFTRELAKRFTDQGIIAHAMEPGVVLESNFVSHADQNMQAYMATLTDRAVTSAEAAETLIWLATGNEALQSNGGYYYQCKPADISQAAQDDQAAKRLWQESEKLIQPFI